MQNFGQLPMVDLLQLFVPPLELLEGFDHGFGHALVGFRRSSDQGEFFAGGDTFVAVLIVETDSNETGRSSAHGWGRRVVR